MENEVLKKVVYHGKEYFLHLTYYGDEIARALILHPDEELYRSPEQIILTVNLGQIAEEDMNRIVAVRNDDAYSGVLNLLINEGVVDPPEIHVQSGFLLYPVCRLRMGGDVK